MHILYESGRYHLEHNVSWVLQTREEEDRATATEEAPLKHQAEQTSGFRLIMT